MRTASEPGGEAALRIVSESGLAEAPDRIVVASAYGPFVAAEARNVTTEGEWVEAGQVLGEVRTSSGAVSVTSPCRGWLLAYLVEDGDRVEPGKPLVHLEAV